MPPIPYGAKWQLAHSISWLADGPCGHLGSPVLKRRWTSCPCRVWCPSNVEVSPLRKCTLHSSVWSWSGSVFDVPKCGTVSCCGAQVKAGGWGLGVSFTVRVVDASGGGDVESPSSPLAIADLSSEKNPFYDPGALRFYEAVGAAMPPTSFSKRKVLAAATWYAWST
jgi:hypothetical protein